jgi:hypothetical protein
MSELPIGEESVVRSAGSYVTKVERKFVEDRLSRRLSFVDGTMVNQLARDGVKATALGMAAVWWAAIGFVFAVFGIIEELTFNSDAYWLKWTGLSVSAVFFLMYLLRSVQTVSSQVRYRSQRRQ